MRSAVDSEVVSRRSPSAETDVFDLLAQLALPGGAVVLELAHLFGQSLEAVTQDGVVADPSFESSNGFASLR